MPRVFLSHSRRDVDLAAGIERALRKLGVEAFDVFESVTPGEDWRQSIKEVIRRTDGPCCRRTRIHLGELGGL
jgi:hypothetical protein